jgi:hypothetical protein
LSTHFSTFLIWIKTAICNIFFWPIAVHYSCYSVTVIQRIDDIWELVCFWLCTMIRTGLRLSSFLVGSTPLQCSSMVDHFHWRCEISHLFATFFLESMESQNALCYTFSLVLLQHKTNEQFRKFCSPGCWSYSGCTFFTIFDFFKAIYEIN